MGIEYLAESVWEAELPSDPANQIAAGISSLRRSFRQGGAQFDVVATRRPGYELIPGEHVRIDSMEFRTLQSEARARLSAGEDRPALSLFRSAIGLWRGPVLSDSACPVWQPEIRSLEEEYFALQEQCSDLQLRLGLHEDVVTELSPFVTRHPLLERPRAQLMRALSESGRQADALQLFQDTAELLDRELGVAPGEDLQRTLQQVLAGDGGRWGGGVRETAGSSRAAAVPASIPDSGPGTPAPTGMAAAPVPSDRTARVPSQLPGDVQEFVGREEEVAFLRTVLSPAGATVPVAVVVGPGGTGKSALAVHAAHRLREVFTDGQLYVNLGGMSTTPVSAHEAVGRFLRELGLSGPYIPDSPDERAALLRSRLAGRRMLLLLDNAEDARQITPLLPGTGSCAVLVTSRIRLTTVPNARILELDVLDPGQAGHLLGRLVGEERLAAEPQVVRELIDYCGGLPLAVRIVGAKLASRPHWSLRKAAARLADERRRLDELAHEGLEVRSTLELSHQGLSPQARRLFRRLALVGNSDFAEWVCAPFWTSPSGRRRTSWKSSSKRGWWMSSVPPAAATCAIACTTSSGCSPRSASRRASPAGSGPRPCAGPRRPRWPWPTWRTVRCAAVTSPWCTRWR